MGMALKFQKIAIFENRLKSLVFNVAEQLYYIKFDGLKKVRQQAEGE